MTRDEAIQKLKAARHRLQGALERFYGHDVSSDSSILEAEALDISVPIRVMVHNVPQTGSHALLSQIEADYLDKPIHFDPLIVAPPRTLPSGKKTMTVVIPVNLAISGSGGTKFLRYPAKGEDPKATLRDWWFGTVWDIGSNQVSNKDIVLALANKEGGAHVADDLSAKYKAAKTQGKFSINGKPVSDVARIGSLVGIAGDELLEYLRLHFPECGA